MATKHGIDFTDIPPPSTHRRRMFVPRDMPIRLPSYLPCVARRETTPVVRDDEFGLPDHASAARRRMRLTAELHRLGFELHRSQPDTLVLRDIFVIVHSDTVEIVRHANRTRCVVTAEFSEALDEVRKEMTRTAKDRLDKVEGR
jgi:hypothetical protein